MRCDRATDSPSRSGKRHDTDCQTIAREHGEQLTVSHARLDDYQAAAAVELDNPVHRRNVDHHAAAGRVGATGVGRAGAPDIDRLIGFAGRLDHSPDLIRAADQDRGGRIACRTDRGVAPIVEQIDLIFEHHRRSAREFVGE